MKNDFEQIKENKKLQEGITMIMDAVSETVEKITVTNLANYYVDIGVTNVLKNIVNIILNNSDDTSLEERIEKFLTLYGIKKIVTTNNQLNAFQSVIDVYNDPEDPNIVTSLSPGYVISTSNGDTILQYENVKINEAHYNDPLDILNKPSEN